MRRHRGGGAMAEGVAARCRRGGCGVRRSVHQRLSPADRLSAQAACTAHHLADFAPVPPLLSGEPWAQAPVHCRQSEQRHGCPSSSRRLTRELTRIRRRCSRPASGGLLAATGTLLSRSTGKCGPQASARTLRSRQGLLLLRPALRPRRPTRPMALRRGGSRPQAAAQHLAPWPPHGLRRQAARSSKQRHHSLSPASSHSSSRGARRRLHLPQRCSRRLQAQRQRSSHPAWACRSTTGPRRRCSAAGGSRPWAPTRSPSSASG